MNVLCRVCNKTGEGSIELLICNKCIEKMENKNESIKSK